MRKIFAIVFVIALMVCALSVPAFAEEVVETTEKTTLTTFTTTEFFNDKVLPFLVSAASALLSGLLLIAPYLKNSGQLKQAKALYVKIKEENETLKSLLESTDVNEFKSTLETILTEDLKKAIQNISLDNNALADLRAKYETLSEMMQALMNAATNVWAQSPAAVACLTNAPDAAALRTAYERVAALENYIREEKGAEAEKIIAIVEGV